MRVLVCGGRDWNDVVPSYDFLDWLHGRLGFSLVIHGGARGADTIAARWANERKIEIKCFPADWDKHKKAAGPIRNKVMLNEGKPELVVAFPGGPGTFNMVTIARNAGVTVIQFPGEGHEGE